jgi:hypothetical protein
MKNDSPTKKCLMTLTVLSTLIVLFTPHGTYGQLQRRGIRVDAGSNQTVSFNVPIGAQQTWVRIVTDPGINPITFLIGRQGNPQVPFSGTANQVSTVTDNVAVALADAIYQFNSPATNVYSIQLDHQVYRTVSAAETWDLRIENNSANVGVFAIYKGDSQSVTEGPDAWLRDNATVDPSGYHTLSNINNLDTSLASTPGEWWKSPAIRFTDQSGAPTQNPVGNQPNNVYVQVRNFGTLPISSVTVDAFWADASAGLPSFPGPSWNPLGSQTVSDIPPGTSKETGSFVWNVPPVPGASQPNHYCVFARIATSQGALDPIDYSSSIVDVITPANTNATHRNVMILSATIPPPSGPFPFFFTAVRFYLTNPLKQAVFTELSFKGIPAIARASQIRLDFRSDDRVRLQGLKCDGQAGPDLGPRRTASGAASGKTSCEIVDTEKISIAGLRLEPGEQRLVEVQFGLSESVRGSLATAIDAVQLVDNRVMGGMTYVLDASAGQFDKLVYVDRVVTFEKGSEGAPGANKFADSNKALGSVVGKQAGDFVSLGGFGSITVRSEKMFIHDEPGDDFTVFVKHDGNPEPYVVEVQPVKRFLFWLIPSDKFVQVGESNGETASFDLAKAGIERAYGIRIIDKSGRLRDKQDNVISAPGVDVVAVGLRHSELDP